MKTTWVKLSDVCETTSGGTPLRSVADYYGGEIPWVKSGELLDGWITDTEEKITKAGLASSSAKLFPAGTLLIALYGATVGRLGILGIDATTNQAVCGITPNEQLDRDFLFYFLLKQREKLIGSRTGGAQPNISQEIIRELDIPLPPLTEQKRIASLLARADRLRQLRRTAHDLGDALLQSVFLEMFGDPETNPKKWKKQPLTELTKYPITYGILKPGDYVSDGVIMLRIQDIKNGRIRKNGLHRVSNELSQQYRRTILTGNEIVISLVGTLALVALIDSSLKGANIHRNLGVIAPKANINTHFLYSYLSLPQTRELIMQVTKGGNQGLLNLEDLRNVQIPVPPLSKQEEFAGVVARVESLRGRMSEAERQVEGLFESLLAQSFDGGR